MAKYAFLSDEWVGEAKRIYAEAGAGGAVGGASGLAPVRVNLVVTDVPFSPAPVDAHVDTSAGRFDIDVGHLDGPDVTISLDYATARSLFVQGDAQAVLQAFLGGRIKVDGDLSKLLDPRSGIWPGPSSAASPGLGSVAQAFGPERSGSPGGPARGEAGEGAADESAVGLGEVSPGVSRPGQQGFGFGGPGALQVATRLQEITE
jgi:hypothetical protein